MPGTEGLTAEHVLPINPTKGEDSMSKLATTNSGMSRCQILISGACMVAAASLPAVTMAATDK